MKKNSQNGKKYNRTKFYDQTEYDGEQSDFPLGSSSYDNYRKIANDKPYANYVSDMSLNNFYKICLYTGVSADYYLGLRDTKRKEVSAPIVKEEFGLSDTSMQLIKKIKDRTPEENGVIDSDVFNFILENTEFWNSFDYLLPLYFAAINSSRLPSLDIDYITYTSSKTFERLIEDIENHFAPIYYPSVKAAQDDKAVQDENTAEEENTE